MYFGKNLRLILAAMSPVMALAQAPQATAPQKPSPSTIAVHAPVAQPQAQSSSVPGSPRFVTQGTFYRPAPNAQPAAGAAPAKSQPTPVQVPQTAQTRPATPQVAQPMVFAPVAVVPKLQPIVSQPVAIPSSSSAGPALVDYAHGELRVVSDKASLGQVLRLVAARTGAVVDLSPELQNEPVVAQLGPASPREVLTQLLDSSRIDYIIMGAGDETGSLQRIVVRTRQTFGQTAMAAVRPQAPLAQGAPEEAKTDEHGLTPAESKLTQEQLMENWKKVREEKRLAEIQQQAQERENEAVQPQTQPEPQPANPTPDGPPEPDNPPQQ